MAVDVLGEVHRPILGHDDGGEIEEDHLQRPGQGYSL